MKAILVIDVEKEDIGRRVNYISVKEQRGGKSYMIGAKSSALREMPNELEEILNEQNDSSVQTKEKK